MSRVTVLLYASFRELAGKAEMQLTASNLEDAMIQVGESAPALAKILNEASTDRERFVILVNGHNIGSRSLSSITLKEGDEIAIFPPVSGG